MEKQESINKRTERTASNKSIFIQNVDIVTSKPTTWTFVKWIVQQTLTLVPTDPLFPWNLTWLLYRKFFFNPIIYPWYSLWQSKCFIEEFFYAGLLTLHITLLTLWTLGGLLCLQLLDYPESLWKQKIKKQCKKKLIYRY